MDGSAGRLFLSLLISSVGVGLFLYGRKQGRIPQLVAGLALVIYPYFVGNLLLMGGLAVALLAGLAVAVRLGA